jgi:LacI family transcriptional regulator
MMQWIKYCRHGGMIFSEVDDAVTSLLQLPQRPDAIFASADKLTTGCFRLLKSRGIDVPHEIALAGFFQ